MKKILLAIVCICLVLLLATCNFPQPGADPTTTPSSQPTTNPTSPSLTNPTNPSKIPTQHNPVIPNLPMAGIALTTHSEIDWNEDGTILFTYTYPNVRLYLTDDEISESVTLDLLNRIDATRSRADAVRADAQNGGTTPYFYSVQYTPRRIDGAILSLSATMTSFTGGAHPGTACSGITYDLLTGKVLTLGDILTKECTAEVLCRLVVTALNQTAEGTLYSDFSVSVEDRFSGNYRSDDSWHLSREGLCFTFEPYEIGPYSSGVITAVIPYEQLPGYLNDAFFPLEQVTAEGSVSIEPLTQENSPSHASVAEVILDPNGDSMILSTDSLVYDLVIYTDAYTGNVLFAADQLTPGSVIVLRLSPSTMLTLHYRSNEETLVQTIRLG